MFACPPLGNCCLLEPVLLCPEDWLYYVRYMDVTTVVCEFAAFSVESDAKLP